MMMIVLRLLSLLLPLWGLKPRLRPPNKPFFRKGGRGVAGFVDSEPKTLVPSASNRSTPEWTRVDSRQGRFDEKQLRAGALPLAAATLGASRPFRPLRHPAAVAGRPT